MSKVSGIERSRINIKRPRCPGLNFHFFRNKEERAAAIFRIPIQTTDLLFILSRMCRVVSRSVKGLGVN